MLEHSWRSATRIFSDDSRGKSSITDCPSALQNFLSMRRLGRSRKKVRGVLKLLIQTYALLKASFDEHWAHKSRYFRRLKVAGAKSKSASSTPGTWIESTICLCLTP